jgi:hypothetical protein
VCVLTHDVACAIRALLPRQVHDDVVRKVIWMPVEELDRLVRQEHKGRFPGLFEGLFRVCVHKKKKQQQLQLQLQLVDEEDRSAYPQLMLSQMFDGVPFEEMRGLLVRDWGVTVDASEVDETGLFCVTYASDIRIWNHTPAQPQRIAFLSENRGTIYQRRVDSGRTVYRVIAMGLPKFWRYDSPQEPAAHDLAHLWSATTSTSTSTPTQLEAQVKYDGFNFKVGGTLVATRFPLPPRKLCYRLLEQP